MSDEAPAPPVEQPPVPAPLPPAAELHLPAPAPPVDANAIIDAAVAKTLASLPPITLQVQNPDGSLHSQMVAAQPNSGAVVAIRLA